MDRPEVDLLAFFIDKLFFFDFVIVGGQQNYKNAPRRSQIDRPKVDTLAFDEKKYKHEHALSVFSFSPDSISGPDRWWYSTRCS